MVWRKSSDLPQLHHLSPLQKTVCVVKYHWSRFTMGQCYFSTIYILLLTVNFIGYKFWGIDYSGFYILFLYCVNKLHFTYKNMRGVIWVIFNQAVSIYKPSFTPCSFWLLSSWCVFFTLFAFRSNLDLYKPGNPDVHRMLRDPSWNGCTLLTDSVTFSGQTRHFRIAGKGSRWSTDEENALLNVIFFAIIYRKSLIKLRVWQYQWFLTYLQIYGSFSLFCSLVGAKRGEFRF